MVSFKKFQPKSTRLDLPKVKPNAADTSSGVTLPSLLASSTTKSFSPTVPSLSVSRLSAILSSAALVVCWWRRVALGDALVDRMLRSGEPTGSRQAEEQPAKVASHFHV